MAEYLSDIEIAQQARMLTITEVAAKAGLAEEQLECYGRHKAKVDIHIRAIVPVVVALLDSKDISCSGNRCLKSEV